MTLREDVAKRLSETWDMTALGLDYDHAPVGWLSLADEAIRLAEWARLKCSRPETEALPTTHHVVPFPPGMAEIRGVRIRALKAITIPPKNFTP